MLRTPIEFIACMREFKEELYISLKIACDFGCALSGVVCATRYPHPVEAVGRVGVGGRGAVRTVCERAERGCVGAWEARRVGRNQVLQLL